MADETTNPETPVTTQKREGQPFEIPVLPLQNTTLFPDTMVPLAVGRPASIAAVEAALASEEKLIGCISVRPEKTSEADPKPAELFEVGTLVMIKRMERVEDTLHLIVQGTDRIRVQEWVQEEPFLRARVQISPELEVRNKEEVEATKRNVQSLIQQALAYLPQVPPEVRLVVLGADDPARLAYFLGSILSLGVEKEQQMLEANTVDELMHLSHEFLAREVEIIRLRSKIATEAQTEMDKAQRDYVLRQQMKAIQKELGEGEGGEGAEAEQLRERLAKADLPDEVRKEAERELGRMEKLPAMAPDYHVIRTYLDFILELPWRKSSEDRLDLIEARKVLDEDHYGLEDVKERILESLAVRKLRPDSKSPILCFVGAPGVGKTSLGRSVARALGRKFHRISLGGMRDEAEIRGHRRTYIGALPGQIVQGLRRAGTKNPVLMLDEIDQIARVCRKVARRRAEGATEPARITPDAVTSFLGAPRFEFEELEERTREPGVATGMAWTPAGGDILLVEATRMAGTHTLTLTGQLGDVMKESVQAALSWVRSHAGELGIAPDFWERSDIHVHVPAGAIPKDGPSAGVTMVAALVSLLAGRPVRGDLAMTGEISLSGRVLPVGGIKEKILAARRAGVSTVILPRRNEKNLLEDVQPSVRESMTFHLVDSIPEMLAVAFEQTPWRPILGVESIA